MAELINITKKYGNVTVLDGFSLAVPQKSKIAIMGGSGKGKTTALRILSGLEKADSGEVIQSERLAYMFQEPRLLPWKSALDNVKLVLPKDKAYLAEKHFSAVGLSMETDAAKLPDALSGGMRQRVAFARFLAFADATDAELLILDEPFSALDEETASKMLEILKKFSEKRSLLIVTHDKSDAETVSDTIIELN